MNSQRRLRTDALRTPLSVVLGSLALLLASCGGGGGSSGSSSGGISASSFAAGLSASPSSLNFGDQALATTSTPSAVYISNTTTTTTGTLNVSVTGSDFSVSSNNCTTLAPGASCTVSFRFTSSTLGSYSSTATVTDGQVGIKIPMSAVSVAAPIACSVVTASAATLGASSATSGLSAAASIQATKIFTPKIHINGSATLILPPPGQASITAGSYVPADIRSAYGLPALSGSWSGLTATQLASYGAGQTVYILDAGGYSYNLLNDLNSFSAATGLPSCTAGTPVVPMPAAGSSCQLTIAYSNRAGGLGTTAPSPLSNWPDEIALDVQWAHAMAPLAQIVLIEAPAADSSLYLALKLANSMAGSQGGVVSLSWGASESSGFNGGAGFWSTLLNGTGMSYVAATGDNDEAVVVPASVPAVIAVGGTSLSYNAGTSTWSEVVWNNGASGNGTGGGISGYTPIPAYQQHSTLIAGEPSTACSADFRAVADVSMNADPYTGVVVYENGAPNAGFGGTSLATPTFAGILAVINAQRAYASKSNLGDIHSYAYATIYGSASNYASAFNDITQGNNAPESGCVLYNGQPDASGATCKADTGYDIPTGLGSPIFNGLAALLGSM